MNRILLLLFTMVTFAVSGVIPINPVFTKETVQEYATKAKNGDPECQYLYALALHQGIGCEKDLILAYEYASKAAENNIGEAYYLLAIGKEQAWDGHRDYDSAKTYSNKYYQWAKREVESTNDIRAHCALAKCYGHGYGVKWDVNAMTNHFTIAAKSGSNEAAEKLCYLYADETLHNSKAAVEWAHVAAERGHISAYRILGCMYGRFGLFGQKVNVNKDYQESLKWLKKSAECGDSYSMLLLGCCYFDGTGVPKGLVEAFSWFMKSAEADYVPSYSMVANCYLNGDGTKKTNPKAFDGV